MSNLALKQVQSALNSIQASLTDNIAQNVEIKNSLKDINTTIVTSKEQAEACVKLGEEVSKSIIASNEQAAACVKLGEEVSKNIIASKEQAEACVKLGNVQALETDICRIPVACNLDNYFRNLKFISVESSPYNMVVGANRCADELLFNSLLKKNSYTYHFEDVGSCQAGHPSALVNFECKNLENIIKYTMAIYPMAKTCPQPTYDLVSDCSTWIRGNNAECDDMLFRSIQNRATNEFTVTIISQDNPPPIIADMCYTAGKIHHMSFYGGEFEKNLSTVYFCD